MFLYVNIDQRYMVNPMYEHPAHSTEAGNREQTNGEMNNSCLRV